MAASHILTLGYGNGSLAGSASLVLTLGYSIGEAAAPTPGRLEYTFAAGLLAFRVPSQRLEFTLPKETGFEVGEP